MKKRCTKCKKELPQTEFHRNHNTGDGYQPTCRKCRGVKAVDRPIRRIEYRAPNKKNPGRRSRRLTQHEVKENSVIRKHLENARDGAVIKKLATEKVSLLVKGMLYTYLASPAWYAEPHRFDRLCQDVAENAVRLVQERG